MEIIGIVLAILSFGATCFKAGYSLGKDVEKSAKIAAHPDTIAAIFFVLITKEPNRLSVASFIYNITL